MLYDVINYNDVTSAADSYKSVNDVRFTDDCRKYCCLICRGWKLLGWASYMKKISEAWKKVAVAASAAVFAPFIPL